MNELSIDIIIITSQRKGHLERCLSKILLWQGAGVIIVADKCDTGTIEYLNSLKNRYPAIETIIAGDKTPKSEKRNAGIKTSKADIVYFLDDDSFPQAENISLLKNKYEQYPEADIIGGPNITPEGSSLFQRIAGYVLASPYTAWKMNRRFSVWKTEENCDDTPLVLCNLAFKRKIFEEDNIYFDGRLHYNEENLLLQQYKAKGRKMVYCPDLAVYHERRRDIFSFSRQVFCSGEGRGIMTVLMPSSFKPVYALPSLLALCVILSIFTGFGALRPVIYLYTVVYLFNSAVITAKNGERFYNILTIFFASFLAHMSYGIGFIRGLGEKWKPKR